MTKWIAMKSMLLGSAKTHTKVAIDAILVTVPFSIVYRIIVFIVPSIVGMFLPASLSQKQRLAVIRTSLRTPTITAVVKTQRSSLVNILNDPKMMPFVAAAHPKASSAKRRANIVGVENLLHLHNLYTRQQKNVLTMKVIIFVKAIDRANAGVRRPKSFLFPKSVTTYVYSVSIMQMTCAASRQQSITTRTANILLSSFGLYRK